MENRMWEKVIPEVISNLRIEHLNKTLPGSVDAAERYQKRGKLCLLLLLKESSLSLSCCELLSIYMAKAIGMGNSQIVIRR